MKKASIIICAAIYALAIIVVAFLGYAAEISNPPVYADDIVLVQEVPYEHMENGALIYTITQKENHRESTTSEDGEEHIQYKYEVHIWDFEFLFDVMEAKISLEAKPISYKVDSEGKQKEPNQKEVSYNVSSENATIDNKGLLTFTKYKDDGSVDCIISSKDGSQVMIFVRLYW